MKNNDRPTPTDGRTRPTTRSPTPSSSTPSKTTSGAESDSETDKSSICRSGSITPVWAGIGPIVASQQNRRSEPQSPNLRATVPEKPVPDNLASLTGAGSSTYSKKPVIGQGSISNVLSVYARLTISTNGVSPGPSSPVTGTSMSAAETSSILRPNGFSGDNEMAAAKAGRSSAFVTNGERQRPRQHIDPAGPTTGLGIHLPVCRGGGELSSATFGSPRLRSSSTISLPPDASEPLAARIKLVVVGKSGAGKTAMIRKFIDHHYALEYQASTVGSGVIKSKCLVKGGKRYDLSIADTPGQEKHHAFSNKHFEDVHGVVLVYDISSSLSFKALDAWHTRAREKVPEGAIFCVVGAKCDRDQDNTRAVQHETGEQLAKDFGAAFFCETSAKTGENIQEPFVRLVDLIMNIPGFTESEDGGAVRLNGNAESRTRRSLGRY